MATGFTFPHGVLLPLVDIWMVFLPMMLVGVTVVCPSLRTAIGTGVDTTVGELGVVLAVIMAAVVGVEGVLSHTSVFTGRTITLSR